MTPFCPDSQSTLIMVPTEEVEVWSCEIPPPTEVSKTSKKPALTSTDASTPVVTAWLSVIVWVEPAGSFAYDDSLCARFFHPFLFHKQGEAVVLCKMLVLGCDNVFLLGCILHLVAAVS